MQQSKPTYQAIIDKNNLVENSTDVPNEHRSIVWRIGTSLPTESFLKTFKKLTGLQITGEDSDEFDLGFLSGCPQLRCLNIDKPNTQDHNPIYCLYKTNRRDSYRSSRTTTDLSPLAMLPRLSSLSCEVRSVRTLEPLSNCLELKSISIRCNLLTSLKGLGEHTNLRSLFCEFNLIESIDALASCSGLTILNISGNEITSLEPLASCRNLEVLMCSDNYIKTLQPLSACTKLIKLNCNKNLLQTLTGIENCLALQELNCGHNEITDLEPVRSKELTKVYVNNTLITSIKALSGCNKLQGLWLCKTPIRCLDSGYLSALQTLICTGTKLVTLDGITDYPNLRTLYVWYTNVTRFDPIVRLKLTKFTYEYDILDLQPPHVQRYIARLNMSDSKTIYADNQNVHDTKVQQSVSESVLNLLADPKPEFDLSHIINSGMKAESIRLCLDFCADTVVHSKFLITFEELLGYVVARIQRYGKTKELFKILGEQLLEADCKCFTGRFTRVLATLVGFYDDIQINISDQSRIAAIIINSQHGIDPYNPAEHRRRSYQALVNAGYDENTINIWTSAIE